MPVSFPFTSILYQKIICQYNYIPESVVDAQLKVYGVDRLRVIDASIFPTIPSGNTNAPVIMVAEKGADMIKRQHLH